MAASSSRRSFASRRTCKDLLCLTQKPTPRIEPLLLEGMRELFLPVQRQMFPLTDFWARKSLVVEDKIEQNRCERRSLRYIIGSQRLVVTTSHDWGATGDSRNNNNSTASTSWCCIVGRVEERSVSLRRQSRLWLRRCWYILPNETLSC